MTLADAVPSESFLSMRFLRWVLAPAAAPDVAARVRAQEPVLVNGHSYRLDYQLRGDKVTVALELDGFAAHSGRSAFTYDRLRQNDIAATGRPSSGSPMTRSAPTQLAASRSCRPSWPATRLLPASSSATPLWSGLKWIRTR